MNNITIKNLSGFTLLEVMIAMIIFSIGMLGLAGIQALSLQNNNTAYQRTIAMQQSYNISDVIRASVTFDGSIDDSFTSTGSGGGGTTTLGPAPTACIVDNNTSLCSTTEMALFNIYHWKKRLASKHGLPSGRGKISKSGDVYTIIIMWDEKRTGVILENCSGDSTTDLKCYKLQIQV